MRRARTSRLVSSPRWTSTSPLQLDHPELAMLGWCLILLAVCVPLALRRFNRTTAESSELTNEAVLTRWALG